MLVAACGGAPAAPAPTSPSEAACAADRAVVLTRQANVDALARCPALGALTIRTGVALDTRALRALTAIAGDLVIGPTVSMQEVTLSELRSVDGALRVVGNGLLQGVFLSRLERAGRIEIDGNVALTTISLPRLAAVHGALQITDAASLELFDAPALVTVDGALVVAHAPRLTVLELDQLQRAESVEIDAPALAPDVVERLKAAATR